MRGATKGDPPRLPPTTMEYLVADSRLFGGKLRQAALVCTLVACDAAGLREVTAPFPASPFDQWYEQYRTVTLESSAAEPIIQVAGLSVAPDGRIVLADPGEAKPITLDAISLALRRARAQPVGERTYHASRRDAMGLDAKSMSSHCRHGSRVEGNQPCN